MKLAFAITLFFLIIIVFELVYSLVQKPDTRPVDKVVERYSSAFPEQKEVDILYYRKFSDIQLLNTILAAIPAVAKLDELMQQGGVKTLAGVFLLSTLFLGGAVFLTSTSLLPAELSAVLACVSMYLPVLYLFYRRKTRRTRFEALLPDALDLMCYSLKAGHSIMASFKMVAEEMTDPIGEEFNRIVDEINYGRDLNSSLRNFARRIDSVELKFFITTIIVQRETGGNLVEMLQKISEVIRRKFRFREKVRALTGEAKLSAMILFALPFILAAAITVTSPRYIMVLLTDPYGHYAMGIAFTMMLLGSFIMYKLVQLEL